MSTDGNETLQGRWQHVPVLRRLIPSARKRIARMLWPDGHGVARREGVLFLLDLRNWYDKVIVTHGPFEPRQRAYLLGNIRSRRCDTFLDIGANMGTYSMFVALRTDCETIIAFEPDQRSYDKLRANLLLNGISGKVETRKSGVSDKNGSVAFKQGPSTHDALSMVDESGTASQRVDVVRLDDAVKLAGRKIALKIDIEGHELVALEGMSGLLRDNSCFLQVECFDDRAVAFIDAMQKRGYKLLHRIDRDHYFANF